MVESFMESLLSWAPAAKRRRLRGLMHLQFPCHIGRTNFTREPFVCFRFHFQTHIPRHCNRGARTGFAPAVRSTIRGWRDHDAP